MPNNKSSEASSLLLNLSDVDKKLISMVEDKLKTDDDKLKIFCDFVCQKVANQCTTDLNLLSPEVKLHACLDYLIIGLVSGSIKSEEIIQKLQE